MHQLEAAICFDDIAWSEALLKGAISCREEMKIVKKIPVASLVQMNEELGKKGPRLLINNRKIGF